MATKREPNRGRKRPVRKKTSNSKIAEAQAEATKRRAERDSPRGQAPVPGMVAAKLEPGGPKLEPRTGTPMAASGRGVDQDQIAKRDNTAGRSMTDAAKSIVGLAGPVMKQMQADAAQKAKQNPLAQIGLYGGSNKDRAAKLAAMQNAMNDTANAQLKAKGQAVWMGPKTVKIRNSGPNRLNEDGSSTTTEKAGDEILTKSELLSWLGDDTKVQQIMAAAQKAGLAVETYDDVSKLWGSVVDMAASSYSLAGKQVTPWALIQLRGKYAGADGKMKPKITTNTNIDEMDPAQARLMFEQTAQQALGRAPTKSEIDDFIAKAQTIAHQNPTKTVTTSQVGFDGKADTENSTSVTTGQGAAQAKAQLASMDQAKQSEDYAAYQAAGNYFPMLFEALQSPV